MPTIDELKRAIHNIEYNVDCDDRDLILSALHSALDRERNEPLTCHGCRYNEPDINSRCEYCKRICTDRYEPKGEQPCTQD